MLRKISLMTMLLLFIVRTQTMAQYVMQDSTFKKYFVGSSAFMMMNFDANDRPDFVQLNLGYRLTSKDAISLELKTWKYTQSLGIPYGKSFTDPEEDFQGYIREYGFALAYQRFWWKGLYTGVHVMNAWQTFVDNEEQKTGDGFQIFNTYRIGYHIKLFNNRFFIEPSVAITHRPFHTEMPESFKVYDDKWSKFFFGEPGLHFGFNF